MSLGKAEVNSGYFTAGICGPRVLGGLRFYSSFSKCATWHCWVQNVQKVSFPWLHPGSLSSESSHCAVLSGPVSMLLLSAFLALPSHSLSHYHWLGSPGGEHCSSIWSFLKLAKDFSLGELSQLLSVSWLLSSLIHGNLFFEKNMIERLVSMLLGR